MKGLDKMKSKKMTPSASEEICWALMHYDQSIDFCALCEKYAFPNAVSTDPKIKTFRTREVAIEAASWHSSSAQLRVIKVRVTVTPIV